MLRRIYDSPSNNRRDNYGTTLYSTCSNVLKLRRNTFLIVVVNARDIRNRSELNILVAGGGAGIFRTNVEPVNPTAVILAWLTLGLNQRKIRHASQGRDISHRTMDTIAASRPMVQANIRRCRNPSSARQELLLDHVRKPSVFSGWE